MGSGVRRLPAPGPPLSLPGPTRLKRVHTADVPFRSIPRYSSLLTCAHPRPSSPLSLGIMDGFVTRGPGGLALAPD